MYVYIYIYSPDFTRYIIILFIYIYIMIYIYILLGLGGSERTSLQEQLFCFKKAIRSTYPFLGEHQFLGGGFFKINTLIPGEMIQFDEHIFQMG